MRLSASVDISSVDIFMLMKKYLRFDILYFINAIPFISNTTVIYPFIKLMT